MSLCLLCALDSGKALPGGTKTIEILNARL